MKLSHIDITNVLGMRSANLALTSPITYQRVDAKLAADRAGLAEWEQTLQATLTEAGQGKREGLVHDLADAVAYLLPFADNGEPSADEADARAALAAYEREHGKLGAIGNPEAQARLPQVRAARDLMANAVANGERDLATVVAAQAEAEEITAALEETFDANALSEALAEIEKIKADRAQTVHKLDAAKALKVAAESAEKKSAEAAIHHADVQAWDLCAAALAPDGIPGELLSEALGPFNARLKLAADDTDWPAMEVGDDMRIRRVDGRPYQLLSEAERWRADAMLAEAISHLSGLRFLMLDRFDVLDQKGRADALIWLDLLAQDGELDTALVFATLKSIPAGLPATVTAHWISGGVIEQLQAAA